MSRLLSVESAAELLNTSKGSLMVTASAYKRDKGKYPKWYVSNGKRGAGKSFVNMDILDNNRQIVRSMWMYSTDSFYWILLHDLGMTETQIAKTLARMSSMFKAVASWVMFLRCNLFGIPPENAYIITADMRTEFFRLSIKMIAIAHKEGRFNDYL